MVLIKGDNDHWVIHDVVRSANNDSIAQLNPNLNNAEYSGGNPINFLSNGFMIGSGNSGGTSGGRTNGNGAIYLYAAWAESPFKYANAK